MDELRKEIQRLLWDSFISARLKTLKKQEAFAHPDYSEIYKEEIRDALKKLRGVETDLHSLLTSIDKEAVDMNEVSSRLGDILTDLSNVIKVLEGWLGEEPETEEWLPLLEEEKLKRFRRKRK